MIVRLSLGLKQEYTFVYFSEGDFNPLLALWITLDSLQSPAICTGIWKNVGKLEIYQNKVNAST